jgi:hypothetical protein
MKRSELLSRMLITAVIVSAVGTPLFFWSRTPLIHGKVAENGGWSPDIIHANVGEPLTLHLTSDDVIHGFAVGQMDMDAVNVEPGKITDVTLKFDKPGISSARAGADSIIGACAARLKSAVHLRTLNLWSLP